MELKDIDILQRIKEDDAKVITLLYKQYHDEFIRFVRKGFPGFANEQAEDAYSECFHALYRNVKVGKLVSLTCSFKSYLFQIGKFKVIDEINRKKREQGDEIIEYHPSEELSNLDFFEEKDDRVKKTRLVSETVSQLKEPCKTLLTLFWFKEKRDKEIVEMTDYKSTDTVKNQRSRCFQTLKSAVLDRFVN